MTKNDTPGIDWEPGSLPVLLDEIEDALPLTKFSVFVGAAPANTPVPTCPIWFDGERVCVDINYQAPFANAVLAVLQAYAMALGLGRLGGLPKTREEVNVFEEALYAVFFEAKKHHPTMADAYRHLGLPDIRGWLKSEMERAAAPIDPEGVN